MQLKYAASAVLMLGLCITQANASATATWDSFNGTSAVGMLDGTTIHVTSSTSAPIIGLIGNHFGMSDGLGGCGRWDGNMPLDHADRGVVASNVNGGDSQEFSFSSPLTDGLFYIENFDSSSVANITVAGATSLTLIDESASISFAASGADSGVLTTTNTGYDGEGDAVIQFTGDVTSILIEYTSGEGENGVFYTFATPNAAVPEPASLLVMGGLFSLCGEFFYLRRRMK